jgi:cytochrome P450
MLLIAGYDSTLTAITNFAYQMLKNPDSQNKLVQELDEKLNGIDPNLDNIKELTYLEACFHESMRLEPPIVRIERKCVCDCKLGEIFVPKGTYISIPIKALHFDPDNFEDPEEFRPERFLAENRHNLKTASYLAFADGPRNCAGLRFAMIEMKYFLAKFLKKYKFMENDQNEVNYEKKINNKIYFDVI